MGALGTHGDVSSVRETDGLTLQRFAEAQELVARIESEHRKAATGLRVWDLGLVIPKP